MAMMRAKEMMRIRAGLGLVSSFGTYALQCNGALCLTHGFEGDDDQPRAALNVT